MGFINNIGAFIWEQVSFWSYELVHIVGTLMVAMYLITSEKKLLRQLIWLWVIWLIVEGVNLAL